MNYTHKLLMRELPLDRTVFVDDETNPVIITFKKDGEGPHAKVFSANCPHQGGPLIKGVVKDGYVSCPWHGCKFDIETGGGVTKLSLTPLKSLIDGEYLYVF